jgi:PKHD-type hydroxylase
MRDELKGERETAKHEGFHSFVCAPYRFYDVFSDEECLGIIDLGRRRPPIAAGLARPIENYRVATAAQLDLDSASRWLFDRLANIFTAVNRWYRFDIQGLREPLLYCEYPPGGQFGWHIDCGSGATASRKISLSVQLSGEHEYSGGALEFAVHGELAESRQRGTVIAFPAFFPHRVEPVTCGIRHALIAWTHGPPFR